MRRRSADIQSGPVWRRPNTDFPCPRTRHRRSHRKRKPNSRARTRRARTCIRKRRNRHRARTRGRPTAQTPRAGRAARRGGEPSRGAEPPVLPRTVGRHWRSARQIAPVRQLAPRQQRRDVQPKAVFPAPAGAPDYVVAVFPRAGAGAVVSVASAAVRVAPAGLPGVATAAVARAAATDRYGPGAARPGAKACRAAAPAWFAVVAAHAAHAGAAAVLSAATVAARVAPAGRPAVAPSTV